MKRFLIALVLGGSLIACNELHNPPINTQENPLLGNWAKINDSNYIVSISDSLIHVNRIADYVCRYTNDSSKLYIGRLWFSDTHPSYEAECSYNLNGDTLQIEEFEMTFAAIYPPQFIDITLIRVKP